MSILNHTNTLRLFKRIFDSKNSTETIIPYYPQKKEFIFDTYANSEFHKNDVVNSKLLMSFLNEIENDKTVNIHSICISINGKTVLKLSTLTHKTNIPHAVHSASKSVTSLACGILISQNKLSLSDKLCDILPEIYNPLTKHAHKNITVENLLMMTTGVGFNETEVYSAEYYDKAFALSPLSFSPGTDFAYNSLNSYMLGRIIEKISGMKLNNFVNETIFTPLGISNYYWEECPKGHTKGGWGLYLSCEDMLKIGNLYLQNGIYNGTRIISKEWIKEATKKRIQTPAEIGDFDYGYHIWVARDDSCYLINGMFGQNVFCFPKSKICVALNGGVDDFFQTSNIYRIVNKYFSSPTTKKSSFLNDLKFKYYLENFSKNYHSIKCKNNTLDFKIHFNKISSKSYKIVSSNSASVGIMPVVLQILQNNYTRGITNVEFYKKDRRRYIIITEGSSKYSIPLDDKTVYYTKLDFNKEIYNVASSADFAINEFGETVLKIKLDFNETASTRFIYISFSNEGINLRFSETPELEFIFANMNYFLKGVSFKNIREAIVSGFESDLSKYIYGNSFKPELKGKLII